MGRFPDKGALFLKLDPPLFSRCWLEWDWICPELVLLGLEMPVSKLLLIFWIRMPPIVNSLVLSFAVMGGVLMLFCVYTLFRG